MQRGPARTWESTKITRVRGASLASQSAMRALPPATAGHSPVVVSGCPELCELLFPHLRGLYVEQIQPDGAGVVMQARSRAAAGSDPSGGAAVLVPESGLRGGHVC